MIKTSIVNPSTQHILDIQKNAIGNDTFMILNDKNAYGQFKSAGRSTAGTTVIVTPTEGGAIVLTDLLISSDRVASSSLLIQFSDDTNKIAIFSGSAADAPINVGIAFAGRWRGWKNAKLELITVSTVSARVAVGYFKISAVYAQEYSDWDAGR